MFNIDPSELMLLAVVALVVIGPKDLPRAMRFVGQWVGRARGMARHFRMGIDEIIRQSELEEMQKKWAAENERIMAEHPMPPPEEADDAAYAFPGDHRAMTALPGSAGNDGGIFSIDALHGDTADAAGTSPSAATSDLNGARIAGYDRDVPGHGADAGAGAALDNSVASGASRP